MHRFLPDRLSVFGLALLWFGACNVDLGDRTPQQGQSFGAIVYREACQRVTYSADVAQHAKDPSHPVDASGASYRALCNGNAMPADSADPTVQVLAGDRPLIVGSVDAALPDDDIQDSLDHYLRALRPLEDDGTVTMLLSRSGALLTSLSQDQGLLASLSHLDYTTGIRPPAGAGGVVRSVASAPGLDAFIGGSVALLVPGGSARTEFTSLLAAAGFELRHLTRDTNPQAPDNTPRLLATLLLSQSPDLQTGTPLLLAQRDFRGLPVLAKIVDPYVLDAKTGLAAVDDAGRFVNMNGKEVLYHPPLPVPGQQDVGQRDAMGRALTPMGDAPLYNYTDLDGSLLYAVLRDAHRLFVPPSSAPQSKVIDIPLGLLRGAALLAGSRNPMAQKTLDNERLSYNGFNAKDSVLLDLAYGASKALGFKLVLTPGLDIVNIVKSLVNLMAKPDNEGPLSRSLKDLLDAADLAKTPDFDNAQIPANSTLYDDLAPIIVRILAVPNLAEDLVAALGDPHVVNLGPMTAQLLNDRDYFFMKQPSTMDEFVNGLDPTGVIGSFGNKPNRAAADSDATEDWRGMVTDDRKNNRSVMERLLHMLADTNGITPFCNARYASVFGQIFQEPCDLFRIDNVARFFLLSIADISLRSSTTTYAKPSASFLEAIKNGNDCRCAAGTGPCRDAPTQTNLCNLVLTNLPDGRLGDEGFAFLLGINTFGRYPEPAAAGRALFLDLWDPVAKAVPQFTRPQPEDLLLNHMMTKIGLVIDQTDPDSRKFVDGAGVMRSFVDEHNGVLFALETVRGPAMLADGTPNPFPDDSFYDAFRPLVNVFARRSECLAKDMTGNCTSGQNAVQILVDAMAVLHRHWPTARSQLFSRSFADSYGPKVSQDGASTYESLGSQIASGDLLLATSQLSPVLTKLLVDVAGDRLALPLIVRLLRYVFDPSLTPGLTYRDGRTTALRNDGQPAYSDDTLSRVLGADLSGKPSIYYLVADAVAKKRAILGKPENQDSKHAWDKAISDALDSFLQVDAVTQMGSTTYHFDNARLRPESVLLLDFLLARVQAHQADLPGWGNTLVSDLSDTLTGPLLASLTDLGVKLELDENARQATYTLLTQLLDEKNDTTLRLMTVAAGDAVQVLYDDNDVVPVGRALSGALDVDKGPVDPGLVLAKRGRDLEQMSPDIKDKPFLPLLLRNLYTPNKKDPAGLYPMFRISDAIAEVNRATPGKPGAFAPEDFQALLANTAQFLLSQDRGLSRFITIVQERCLPGATDPGCPK